MITNRTTNQPLETVIQIVKELSHEIMPLIQRRDGNAIQRMRSLFDTALTTFPVADDITCETITINKVAAEWVIAPDSATTKILLYLHGGGYVFSSARNYRNLVSRLAQASGVRALSVDYRLAPEHPFPAAVQDAILAYRWLVSTGIHPRHIVIAGDSAGGGLAIATLVALRDAGDPLPAAAVCISPWIDLECNGKSMATNAATDPMIQKELVQFLAQHYVDESFIQCPLASPIYADLDQLPPLMIQVADTETLFDDARRLARHAQQDGVDVLFEIWTDMIHVWHLFAPVLPEGQDAIEKVGAFIRKHIDL
ncbi:MAG: alpha/beta hydrolase [Elainellaceae cyanobacterium]